MIENVEIGDIAEYRNKENIKNLEVIGTDIEAETGKLAGIYLVTSAGHGFWWSVDAAKNRMENGCNVDDSNTHEHNIDLTYFPCYIVYVSTSRIIKIDKKHNRYKFTDNDVEFFFPNRDNNRDPNCPWEFL